MQSFNLCPMFGGRTTIDDLEHMSRKLTQEYEQCGQEFKITKTVYMCVEGHQHDLLLQTLNEANSDRKIERRQAIALLNTLLFGKNIKEENKKTYKAIVRSIISYSSEV